MYMICKVSCNILMFVVKVVVVKKCLLGDRVVMVFFSWLVFIVFRYLFVFVVYNLIFVFVNMN